LPDHSDAVQLPIRRRLSLLAALAFGAGLVTFGTFEGIAVRGSGLSVKSYDALLRTWETVALPLTFLAVLVGIAGVVVVAANRRTVWGIWFALAGVALGVASAVLSNVAGIPLGRPSERKAECLAHVKDLAADLGMYLADWDRFPPSDTWEDVAKPYWRHESSILCPDMVRVRVVTEKESYEQLVDEIKAGKWPGSYAYNSALGGRAWQSVQGAEQVVCVFESDRGWNAAGGPELLPKEPRHLGGDNYGFVDGHAKWYSRQSVIPPTEHSPRWSPGPTEESR